MLPSTDPRKVQTYTQGLAACKKAIHLLNEPVEWVEVPFKDQSLPALFTKPSGKGPFPCMIHFDGFDMHKDFLYIMHADAFLKRGMAMLLVDHPGVGEALRLRGMPSKPDTEVPAAAAVDYLERRQDVYQDVYSDRIGIIAQSLGGYYAPRAAAFEKRFKCCIAFGAVWDWGELVTKRIRGKGDAGHKSVPKWEDHLMWVLGKDNIEDAVDVAKQMTLEGVAEKITCPFLIIHGENDRQIPLSHAEKTVEAAENSPKRELKVFTLAEGGAEHCQIDNRTMGLDYAADWAAEILGGNPKGI
jgi:dienelactone hydrolase